MLELALGWLASKGVGLILGALAKAALDAWQGYQATESARARGRAEAINDGLTRASLDLERASAAIREAEQKHVADPTDDAFDNQFRRKP